MTLKNNKDFSDGEEQKKGATFLYAPGAKCPGDPATDRS